VLDQLHRATIISLIGGFLLGGALVPGAHASAAQTIGPSPSSRATRPAPPTPTETRQIRWKPCADSDSAECGTLTLPVDWNHPSGRSFELALARRSATGDPPERIGSLIFGPGGPGDSGVDRVVDGVSRFSADLQRRFDIVSFDPRGVGDSNPVRCSSDLLARQPSPLLASQADFEATLAFNRRLATDCRRHTGPVFDHLDTLSTVRDLDAIRQALGERTLTFHGSSYGTLLGAQYAETFPHRVRALVLESVIDHSLGTSAFLQTQAEAEQDSFDAFVAWCERTKSCALHGHQVRAVWSTLLERAHRGELPSPDDPGTMLTPYTLSSLAQIAFYGPDWADLAKTLANLNSSRTMPDPKTPTPDRRTAGATSKYPFAVFCQDFDLPVRDYSEYAAMLRRIAQTNPDMRYPRSLLAIGSCLGATTPVNNPQHRLIVRGSFPILLTNSLHDPATGYNWATNVARQLGNQAVLLTYEGAGHGTYNSTPCAQAAIDQYLIARTLPSITRCPALDPAD
jgi:pimeloyl-ACP methyl ester carboxylesterase